MRARALCVCPLLHLGPCCPSVGTCNLLLSCDFDVSDICGCFLVAPVRSRVEYYKRGMLPVFRWRRPVKVVLKELMKKKKAANKGRR